MQTIAAYRLERRDHAKSSTSPTSAFHESQEVCLTWLAQKGGDRTQTSGPYDAADGSHAEFGIEEATDGADLWWMLRLLETTAEGRQTRTSVSVTRIAGDVVVYVTVEVGYTDLRITKIPAKVKCPRVVRMLLGGAADWSHGGSPSAG